MIYQRGKMHLELIHILGKRVEVFGYVIFLIFFSFKKVNIVELIPVLVLILYSCFTEVSMGSLAGSDPYNIDYSSCSIISAWSI